MQVGGKRLWRDSINAIVRNYVRTCHSRKSSVGESVVNAVIEGGGNPAVRTYNMHVHIV